MHCLIRPSLPADVPTMAAIYADAVQHGTGSFELDLHLDARGRGLGRLLLAERLARCAALGARQMLAVIGDSQNLSSIQLHRGLGFEQVGQLGSVGRRFERWLDIVLMQRSPGAGAATPPHA